MDLTGAGLRVVSGVVGSVVKQLLLARTAPGAGVVDRPVRVSSLLSFTGARPTVTRAGLHRLARELVRRAARAAGPGDALPADQHEPLAAALADSLHGLGGLTMDDVQAVRLGPERLAAALPEPSGLPEDARLLHRRLLELACLHLIQEFTARSTFVSRTLVEVTHRLGSVGDALTRLEERVPGRHAEDLAFEEVYRGYIARRHGNLRVFGIDRDDEWPLDGAYLSLETTHARSGPRWGAGSEPDASRHHTPQRAEAALDGQERVLLRGGAGSGKTTLVQWLAVTAADDRPGVGTGAGALLPQLLGRVPLVLPMRTLTRGGRDLPLPADFLASVGTPHTEPPGWTERVLSAGRGLLLVDGIDEIPERDRDEARSWLRALVRDFPGNVWLVTVRPSAVAEDWLARDGFHELSLSPMSHTDVTAFVQRWHRATGTGQEQAQDLLTALRSTPDLARLATNPLMCSLICALHRTRHGYLPRRREELYDAALRMLLEQRDRERKVVPSMELDARSRTMLLQKLAYWMIRNGRAEMEREDAVDLIAGALPSMPLVADQADAEEVYRFLLERSGLLREPTAETVEFVHRTFQDYLGAREAVESRDIPLLIRNAHRDQFEDVIRMAVAHGRPQERKRLLDGLVKRGDRVKTHRLRLHLLAMACLEHATELDPGTRASVTERAATLIPPRSVHEARSLAQAGPVVLGLLPAPESVTPLEAAQVCLCLAEIGGNGAIDLMARYARAHPDHHVPLAGAWNQCDAELFATAVLPALNHTLKVVVSTTDQLALARELPSVGIPAALSAEAFHGSAHWPRLRSLHLRGPGPVPALAELPRLDTLVLTRNELTTLEPLGEGEVGGLIVLNCRQLSGLKPSAGLRVRSLVIRNDGPWPLSDLGRIRGLRELDLHISHATGDPLRRLPPEVPLTRLEIDGPVSDLSGLRDHPRLRGLCVDEAALEDRCWEQIAGNENLSRMVLSPSDLRTLAALGIGLPRIDWLHLSGRGEEVDSRQLAAVFPGLRDLRLRDVRPSGLLPVAERGRLVSLELIQAPVPGLEELPETVAVTIRQHPVRY